MHPGVDQIYFYSNRPAIYDQNFSPPKIYKADFSLSNGMNYCFQVPLRLVETVPTEVGGWKS